MDEIDNKSSQPLAGTGVEGLDEILRGGLIQNRLYVVEGDPGSGKTTLALQFLLEGARLGEKVLYVALSETEEELRTIAMEHGWSLDGLDLFELWSGDQGLTLDARYTMFHPSEVELTETTKALIAEVELRNPSRVVVDSLSELRLLSQNPLRYRRQILALKQYFANRKCTVVLVDDRTAESTDMQLRSIAHGVIGLERRAPDYGMMRRRLQVVKIRGWAYLEGYHDFQIKRGGLEVFPRLVAAGHFAAFKRENIGSGLDRLDQLLGGGLTRGTSTLITGPAGSGKSSLAAQYASASAVRGERASFFLFDESIATFRQRCSGLGLDINRLIEEGTLRVTQIDPAAMSPGQFSQVVRAEAEGNEARLVVIDSLNGYLQSMPSEKLLTIHLHELLTYLGQRGVTAILIMAQHGLVSATTEAPVDTSYLADTVILTRFFETSGEVRQAVSVIKKRTGHHERTIREMRLDSRGIIIGEPLREFEAVLSGAPMFVGKNFSEASRGGKGRSKL